MLQKLRKRVEDEKGFTLIELLVVILIIGILAAVAIPTFLNQRGKAYDANTKSMVKDMQTAEETYATSNNGSYTTSLAALNAIDPSIPSSGTVNGVSPNAPTLQTGGYVVSATASSTGDSFTISEASGQQTNSCSAPGAQGGSPGGCVLTGGTGTAGTW